MKRPGKEIWSLLLALGILLNVMPLEARGGPDSWIEQLLRERRESKDTGEAKKGRSKTSSKDSNKQTPQLRQKTATGLALKDAFDSGKEKVKKDLLPGFPQVVIADNTLYMVIRKEIKPEYVDPGATYMWFGPAGEIFPKEIADQINAARPFERQESRMQLVLLNRGGLQALNHYRMQQNFSAISGLCAGPPIEEAPTAPILTSAADALRGGSLRQVPREAIRQDPEASEPEARGGMRRFLSSLARAFRRERTSENRQMRVENQVARPTPQAALTEMRNQITAEPLPLTLMENCMDIPRGHENSCRQGADGASGLMGDGLAKRMANELGGSRFGLDSMPQGEGGGYGIDTSPPGSQGSTPDGSPIGPDSTQDRSGWAGRGGSSTDHYLHIGVSRRVDAPASEVPDAVDGNGDGRIALNADMDIYIGPQGDFWVHGSIAMIEPGNALSFFHQEPVHGNWFSASGEQRQAITQAIQDAQTADRASGRQSGRSGSNVEYLAVNCGENPDAEGCRGQRDSNNTSTSNQGGGQPESQPTEMPFCQAGYTEDCGDGEYVGFAYPIFGGRGTGQVNNMPTGFPTPEDCFEDDCFGGTGSVPEFIPGTRISTRRSDPLAPFVNPSGMDNPSGGQPEGMPCGILGYVNPQRNFTDCWDPADPNCMGPGRMRRTETLTQPVTRQSSQPAAAPPRTPARQR